MGGRAGSTPTPWLSRVVDIIAGYIISSIVLLPVTAFALVRNRARVFRDVLRWRPWWWFGRRKCKNTADTIDFIREQCEVCEIDVDVHEVRTADGVAVLALHLVPRGEAATESYGGKTPVLLVHGLMHWGGVFFCNGKSSLALYLARCGFDVWIGNNRGILETIRGRKAPVNYTVEDLGKYDFAALTAYVAGKAEAPVVYIGHSQGTAQAFFELSRAKSGAGKNVALFIALAPAAHFTPQPHPVLRGLAAISRNHKAARYWLGTREFMPVFRYIKAAMVGRASAMFAHLGYAVYSDVFGWKDDNWDRDRSRVFFESTVWPCAVRQMLHWGQCMQAGVLVHYEPDDSQPLRPIDVSAVRVPVALFYGAHDLLIDGDTTRNELDRGCSLAYAERIPHYEHMDVLWSPDAEFRVWRKVAELAHAYSRS